MDLNLEAGGRWRTFTSQVKGIIQTQDVMHDIVS